MDRCVFRQERKDDRLQMTAVTQALYTSHMGNEALQNVLLATEMNV